MDQLINFFTTLNKNQKAVIIGGLSILVLFLIGLLIYSNMKANDAKLNYTIATGLTKNQVLLASTELENANIPFAIIGNGNNLILKTNKDNVNIAKIKLVTSESVISKHTGWEIFDKSSLGATNFENQVKLLRATEGELARSLESLIGIISASVKIAIPKESVFTQQKKEPSASAVLSLRPGTALTQQQIEGIKSFISSAVANLRTDNIKLIDQNGALLEQNMQIVENQRFITHEKYKKKLELDYEEKIINLLEPFIGNNNVVARVTVTLDFKNQMIEEEIFEPEGTIRSQQTTESSSTSQGQIPKQDGIPGVQNNIENTEEEANNEKSESSSNQEKNIVNYEISKKIIKQKDNAFAKIENIKAAVTFDSTILDEVQNKDEFLNTLKTIVEDGIGIDSQRGDKISVAPFKFLQSSNNITDSNIENQSFNPFMAKSFFQEYGEYLQYLIASILLFVFYKKFIANNDINLNAKAQDQLVGVANENFDYKEDDKIKEKNALKGRIRDEILNNLDDFDQEIATQYEVLLEELDNQINNQPEDIAKMLELLLAEGDAKLKKKKEQ